MRCGAGPRVRAGSQALDRAGDAIEIVAVDCRGTIRTLVNLYLALVDVLGGEHDEHWDGSEKVTRHSKLTGVLALLAAQDDGVATEEREQLHRGGVERRDRVIVRRRLVHDETVRPARVSGVRAGTGHVRLLGAQDGCSGGQRGTAHGRGTYRSQCRRSP